jgi:hypothetical protein
MEAFRRTGVGMVKQLSPPWFNRSVDTRQAISRKDLQSAITDVVKNYDPECEPFVDVIIEIIQPRSRVDANWVIRGVRFGRADRDKSQQALAKVVERMQSAFIVSE